MPEKVLFISHVHEDGELAKAIRDLIKFCLPNAFDVFVSSDGESIRPGDDWMKRIADAVERASDFIIILTPISHSRPWVHFEAGAAFGSAKGLVPVCARGFTIRHLGPPLSARQCLDLSSEDGVLALIKALADRYGLTVKKNTKKVEAVLTRSLIDSNDLPPPLTPDAKSQERIHLDQMWKDWDGLNEAQQIFWGQLLRCYEKLFRGKSGYPDTIEGLVDEALPLKGLPLKTGEQLINYPTTYGRLLNGADSLLYAVSNQIYPRKDPTRDLEECSIIDGSVFKQFHDARRSLSLFFERWGGQVYRNHVLDIHTVIDSFRPLGRTAKILGYLETSLTQWTQDSGVGKQWLFRLGRDWDRC